MGAPLPQFVNFLIFDNLTEQTETENLVCKQHDDSKHQVLGYFAVPLDHDIAGAEVFFQPTVCAFRT